MLVSEQYEIDLDELYLKADREGGYWGTVYEFYSQVVNSPIDSLSQKQKEWLENIESKLGENYDG